ncbi:Signal transduction histidine-protein kinase BarA [Thalassocella blandensis]|nr:Signal transduction histidine-protein kinase BarA [Thalassocella blandensis]
MDINRFGKHVIALVFIASVTPILLWSFGFSLGVDTPSMEYAQLRDNARLVGDVWMQWMAVAMAVLAGIAACLHFFAYRDVSIVCLGVALVFCGGLEFYFYASSYTPLGLETDKLNSNWIASKSYFALCLILMPAAIRYLQRQYSQKEIRSFYAAAFITALGTLLGMMLVILYLGPTFFQPDQEYFPQQLIKQPAQLVPLVLFFAAVCAIGYRFHHRRTLLNFILCVSLLPAIVGQLQLVFFSTALFDHHYFSAQILYFVTFLLIFWGTTSDFSAEHATANILYGKGQRGKNAAPKTSELDAAARLNSALGNPDFSYLNTRTIKPSAKQEQVAPVMDFSRALPLGSVRFPLSVRIPLGAFALSLIIASVVGYSFYLESQKIIVKNEIKDLSIESKLVEPLLAQLYQNSASDALFLSGTPPIQGLIKSIKYNDEENYVLWEDRLQQIFEQFLKNRDIYLQARYIGLGDLGKELVNVLNKQGDIRRIPKSRLQLKGERDYFKSTILLHPGRVYFSEIELNKEWGEVILPHEIVLRVATPVYDEESGDAFGIVILNIDINRFISQLNSSSLSNFDYYLANGNGVVLYHPEHEFLLGKSEKTLNDFFPELGSKLRDNPTALGVDGLADQQGQKYTVFYREIAVTKYGSLHPLKMVLYHKQGFIHSELLALRDRSLILGIAMALIALAIALIISRRLVHPLRQISESVQLNEKGSTDIDLPIHSNDETGVLARAIYNLMCRVKKSTEEHAAAKSQAEEVSARLSAVIDSAADAIITINRYGEILSVNIAAKAMFNYAEEELIGQPISMLMPEEYGKQHNSYVQNYLRTGQGKIIGKGRKLVGKKRNGDEFPMHLTVTKVETQGEIIFTGLIRDVSEVDSVNRALEESSRQLELVIGSMEAGIWDWNLLSNRMQLNSRMSEMLGYSASEMEPCTYQSFTSQMHAEDLGNARLFLEEHFKGNVKYQAEIRVKHKKGHWIWVLDAGKVIERDKAGNPTRMLGIRLDISDKKKAFANAEEMAWRMNFALTGSKVGIWDFDLHTQTVVWDERMYELYGVTRASFSGNNENWLAMVHPDDVQHAKDDLQKALKNFSDFSSSFRILRPDGQVRYIEAFGKLQRDEMGHPTRIVGTNRDVTEQQRLTEEREQALEKANESARMKSEFLASMSHEIRTPMNGVLGMLGLLQKTRLEQTQNYYLKLARSSAESLLTVINDILDFSKVESGKLQLENHDFDLRQQLGEFIESVAQAAQEKGLEIILDTKNITTNHVSGDSSRLRQILTNLVSNAITFTSEGEVVVRVATRQEDSGGIRIDCSVMDTGMGISREKQATLFEAFTQADASSTRKHGGTGLGLAIAKQICELMGGGIQVISDQDVGSCFSFHVSMQQSDKQPLEVPEFDASKLTALIVDDSKSCRDVIRAELEKMGAKVVDVDSAANAMLSINSRIEEGITPPFDVAYIDMRMPKVDGVALAQQVREIQPCNAMSMIMMTSMTKAEDPSFFADLGFRAFFHKPVISSDVLDSITIVANASKSGEPVQPFVGKGSVRVGHTQTRNYIWPEDVRVLLVEDNRINQVVAAGLMEDLGLSCDIAANGLEALITMNKALYSAAYTLIIMDCQMPEMDGFEATHNIRKGLAGEQHKNVPIVALTANAMKGDKEKCLASGMNDYLSKPINPSELENRLVYWLKPTAEEASGEVKSSEHLSLLPAEVDTQKPQPVTLWDEAAALSRVRGKPDRLLKLLDLFLADMPDRIGGLQNALVDKEFQLIAESAHAIKGVAANIAAIALMEDASEIEKIARDKGVSGLTEKMPQFFYHYKETEQLLRGYVDQQSPPTNS